MRIAFSLLMTRHTLRMLQTRLAACGWQAVVLRALGLAAGWWILIEGESTGLVFGTLVVLTAVVTSVSLAPAPSRWQLVGLLQIAFMFIAGSIRGGVDVARRALGPRVRIAPCVMEYTLRLPEGPARDLLAATLSLMPGTLAITYAGQRLVVHVLAARSGLAADLASLEASIARATGARLEEPRA